MKFWLQFFLLYPFYNFVLLLLLKQSLCVFWFLTCSQLDTGCFAVVLMKCRTRAHCSLLLRFSLYPCPSLTFLTKFMPQSPEFLLDFSKTPGFITPRLYVPFSSQSSDFYSWFSSIRVLDTYEYSNGNLTVWYSAPLNQYYRFASSFPHSNPYHHKRTHDLLHFLSTSQNLSNYPHSLCCGSLNVSQLALYFVLIFLTLPHKIYIFLICAIALLMIVI